MKLKNNLYYIIDKDAAGTHADIRLNPECLIYKAHFPGKPITPGVCLVETGRELLEELHGADYAIREVVNAKFLHVVEPDATPLLRYRLEKFTEDSEPDTFRATMSAVNPADGTVMSKLSFRLLRK